jgi:DNA topoisomerase-2
MSTDCNIDIKIRLLSGNLYDIENEDGNYEGTNGIHKLFNLSTTMHLTNMNLFDYKEQLRKYNDYFDIVIDYVPIRLKYYILRKNYLQQEIEKELNIISNKVKYINLILDDIIDLRKKNKDSINAMLTEHELVKQQDKKNGSEYNYNYLIKMPMDSVSKENVEKLNKEHKNKTKMLDEIKRMSIYEMWYKELDELEKLI